MSLASQLDRAVKAAGVTIEGVSIGDPATKATWRVTPVHLQGAAQATIDAFNPADPAHEQADLDAAITSTLDTERVISAVVWAMIDQLVPPATPAKYQAARTKIIAAYKATPWK